MIVDGDAGKVFARLAKAQAEFEGAAQSTQGYGYKYADLAEVWASIRKPLADNGLFVGQYAEDVGPERVGIVTVIGCEEGSIRFPAVALPLSRLEGGAGKNPTQIVGATITYARRYALESIFCLSRVDDTDGVPARKAQRAQQAPPASQNDDAPEIEWESTPPMSDGHDDTKKAYKDMGKVEKTAYLNAIGSRVHGDRWDEVARAGLAKKKKAKLGDLTVADIDQWVAYLHSK